MTPLINPFRDLARWHDLLSHRFVCEKCLTRYFYPYKKCRACGMRNRIKPLANQLFRIAHSDLELRNMLSHTQLPPAVYPFNPPPPPEPFPPNAEGPP